MLSNEANLLSVGRIKGYNAVITQQWPATDGCFSDEASPPPRQSQLLASRFVILKLHSVVVVMWKTWLHKTESYMQIWDIYCWRIFHIWTARMIDCWESINSFGRAKTSWTSIVNTMTWRRMEGVHQDMTICNGNDLVFRNIRISSPERWLEYKCPGEYCIRHLNVMNLYACPKLQC